MLKNINENYFRMLILGKTGSGKTYFLNNQLLPKLSKKYTMFYIFTTPYNIDVYKQVLTELEVPKERQKVMGFTDVSLIPAVIQQIELTIAKDKVDKDSDGHPIFRDHSLLVFDDILDDKVMSSMEFRGIFTRFRHIQASAIILAQITTKAVTPAMKGNMNYGVYFQLESQQMRFAVEMIRDILMSKDIKLTKIKATELAKKIYIDNVQDHGYVITTDKNEIIVKPKGKTKKKELQLV